MFARHWSPRPFPVALRAIRTGYRRALERVRSVPEIDHAKGRKYVRYWIGRLEFGIGYLDAIEATMKAAACHAEARSACEAGDDRRAKHLWDDAIQQAESAFDAAVSALETFAGVARDQSDRGALATMNEYVYRFLKGKVADLRSAQTEI
jgi:hypothetical protein